MVDIHILSVVILSWLQVIKPHKFLLLYHILCKFDSNCQNYQFVKLPTLSPNTTLTLDGFEKSPFNACSLPQLYTAATVWLTWMEARHNTKGSGPPPPPLPSQPVITYALTPELQKLFLQCVNSGHKCIRSKTKTLKMDAAQPSFTILLPCCLHYPQCNE